MIRIASFDVGKKNLAFYTEDVKVIDYLKMIQSIKNIDKKDLTSKRNCDGTLKLCIKNTLQDIYLKTAKVKNGYGVFDITDKSNNFNDEKKWNYNSRFNLHKLLLKYKWLWDTVDILIIEEQFINLMSSKSRQQGTANIQAIKIAECIYMWFITNYNNIDEECKNIKIEYFCSKYKTQLLGAPFLIEKKSRKTGKIEMTKMTKYDRKKWSVEKTISILKDRNDLEFIKELTASKVAKQKLDDISDCLIQLQAWKLKKIIEMRDSEIKLDFSF